MNEIESKVQMKMQREKGFKGKESGWTDENALYRNDGVRYTAFSCTIQYFDIR